MLRVSMLKTLKTMCGPLRGPFGLGTPPPSINTLDGQSLPTLKQNLRQWRFADIMPAEWEAYLEQDFLRFVYTVALVPKRSGRLLELGAGPYFTTLLLKWMRNYELSLTNYFEGLSAKTGVHYLCHQTEP